MIRSQTGGYRNILMERMVIYYFVFVPISTKFVSELKWSLKNS